MKPGFRSIAQSALIGAERRYRLVNAEGQYLHQSCQALCRDPAWAWEGSAEQMKAVQRKFPGARNLHAFRLSALPDIEPLRKGDRI